MLRVLVKTRLICPAFTQRSQHINREIRQWKDSGKKLSRDVLLKNATLWRVSSSQHRCLFHTESDNAVSESGQWKTVYEGPIAKSVKFVKILSLTTAATMFVVAPLTIFFGKQAASLPLKVCLVIFLCSIGCASTGLLHWVSQPYVRRMAFNPREKRFAVETLSLFASARRAEFSVDDITVYRENRPFSTFEVHGVKYFIHTELVEAQQILHFIEQWKAGDEVSPQSHFDKL